MTRYTRITAGVAFGVFLLVGFTASTPLWLTGICAAAAMALVPVFLPAHKEEQT